MNRGQLKTRVSRLLGLAVGTNDDALDEDAYLNELANEAVKDVLARTRIYVRDATIPLTTGVTEYDVTNQSILKLHRIVRGTTDLQEQPLDLLDAYGYAWVGFNRFQLGLAATAGETLYVLYTPMPTDMTLDAHDPAVTTYGNIPVQFHPALINYMCWWAADKAGDQAAGRGEKYRVKYEGQDGMAGPGTNLGVIKAQTNMRGGGTRVKRYRETLQSDVDTRYWS